MSLTNPRPHPCLSTVVFVFPTASDNKMQVCIHVLQGELEMAMGLASSWASSISSASHQHQGPCHRLRWLPLPKTKPTSATMRRYRRNGRCFLHRVCIATPPKSGSLLAVQVHLLLLYRL